MLGAGAYGKVFLFKDKNPSSETEYAVKVLLKDGRSNRSLACVRKEISILSLMDHPNVIRYIESFEDDRYMYIVTEYLSKSRDLQDFVS